MDNENQESPSDSKDVPSDINKSHESRDSKIKISEKQAMYSLNSESDKNADDKCHKHDDVELCVDAADDENKSFLAAKNEQKGGSVVESATAAHKDDNRGVVLMSRFDMIVFMTVHVICNLLNYADRATLAGIHGLHDDHDTDLLYNSQIFYM